MKKSFSLLEIIFVLIIITIISSMAFQNKNISKIKLAKEQLILHLKYMRYISMIDNKYNHNDNLWYRKAWNMKFLNCSKNIGGIYYVIYENVINTNHWAISKSETLKDPLTSNYIYSYQCKKDELYDKSKFVLLSQYYGIKKINISCNESSSLGQILFLNNGSAYTKFNNNYNDMNKYKIQNNCKITLLDGYNQKEYINIEANTGFIH